MVVRMNSGKNVHLKFGLRASGPVLAAAFGILATSPATVDACGGASHCMGSGRTGGLCTGLSTPQPNEHPG